MMIRRITKSKWFTPALLFFFTLISYGIYIPRLGLFGDDWIYLYSYHVAGSAGYPAFVASDRPFSAWIYQLTSLLFAERVWMYHTFLFLLRWLSAALVWLILREIWPKQRRQTAAIAVIFSIYPAFLQQAISLEFILHFSILCAFLLSLYCMILAVKHPKQAGWLTIVGVLLAGCHFSIEYFVGLEATRPVILYVLSTRKQINRQKRKLVWLIKRWLPYLAMLLAFAIWRVFIFKFPSYKPHFFSDLLTQPGVALRELMARMWADAKIVFCSSWAQIFAWPVEKASRTFWLLMIVTLLVAFFAFALLKTGRKNKAPLRLSPDRWPFVAILSGLFLFLICGWPFWITKVPLELVFPWDRTILSFMLASSFWIVGLVDLFFRPKMQPLILAVLLTFTVAFHYFNARVYENEQKKIQQYFWQLSWRIPELKPGTLLLTQDLPLNRESDNDLGGTLNWMFAPERKSNQIQYLMYDFTSRDRSIIPVIAPDQPVNHGIRSLQYESTTSEILSVYWNGSDCVWLLLADEAQPTGIPMPLREFTVLSDDDQIIPDPQTEREPPAVLGDEPTKGWCYFYQKAELARQSMNWEEVVRLAEEAEKQGYQANNGYEYLPFVEAYVQSGDYEKAFNVSKKVQNSADYTNAICDIWSKIEQEALDLTTDSFVQKIQSEFNCTP
jgi:hypothetical protein